MRLSSSSSTKDEERNIENRRVYCNFLFTEYTHHRICIKCLPLYTAKLFHMQG